MFKSVAVAYSRAVFRLPVKVNVPVAGLYSSALDKKPLVDWPPAISTIPLFKSVAVALSRALFRLPVDTNPAVAVKVVEPLILFKDAPIVVLPCARLVARPAALIVATFGGDELHVSAPELNGCVLPSLNVPVAVNCSVPPIAIEGFAGVTAIDTRTGAVMVKFVEPLIELKAAVIVVLPCATLVATPAVLIVAMPVNDELHVAVPVRFCVLPSL